ncbi:Uncharacterised protein [Vibrio cholerae]|nr:Uncharacterised protein [Vibrio cholerae]
MTIIFLWKATYRLDCLSSPPSYTHISIGRKLLCNFSLVSIKIYNSESP